MIPASRGTLIGLEIKQMEQMEQICKVFLYRASQKTTFFQTRWPAQLKSHVEKTGCWGKGWIVQASSLGKLQHYSILL
jgi:hypothetical protein